MWFVACEQVLDDFPRGCQIRFCLILQQKIVGKDEPRMDIFPREFWASGTCIIYLYSCTRYLQPTPTRKSYWFQQDGAFIHTTVAARSWLQGQVRRPSHQSPHCAPLACQKPWPLSVGLMVLWRLHGGSTQNNTSIPKRPKGNGGGPCRFSGRTGSESSCAAPVLAGEGLSPFERHPSRHSWSNWGTSSVTVSEHCKSPTVSVHVHNTALMCAKNAFNYCSRFFP